MRPSLSPGEVREPPKEDPLLFVTGYTPMRVKKVRYHSGRTFMKRVLPPRNQSQGMNVPPAMQVDWLRERAKGRNWRCYPPT